MPHRAVPAAAALLLALVALASGPPDLPAKKGVAAGPAKSETVELRGRVSAPDGKPVAGATIRILPEPKPSKAAGEHASTEATVVESGEDGNFAAGKLVGTSFLVRVEADGFAPFSQTHVPGGTSLDVRLVAGHALAGSVFDLRSGTPLVGATVTVCDAGATPFGRDACREARSGEGGAVRFVDLPRGAVDVEALADGHAVGRARKVAVPPPEADDGSPRRFEIFLSPGARIGGRVVDLDDRPIEGATVTLELWDPEYPEPVERERRSETTDAAGRFSFERVPLDERFRVQGSAEGYASNDMAAAPDMTICLHAGATVDVRLLDATDVPIETLEVEFDSSDDPNRGFLPMDPDLVESLGEGRFRMTRLPLGTYTVRLLPEGYADVERENVVLREGGSVDLGTIVVREGKTIAGTVTNDAGEPIAGAEIRALFEREGLLIRRAVRTSVEGKYRVPGLGEEPARLSVSAQGHGTDERSGLLPGAEDVDFVLERTGSVVGRIVLEGGGVPAVSQVRAHLETGDDPGQTLVLTLLMEDLEDNDAGTFSDPDGRYRVDGLAPGTYTIEAIARGFAAGKATGLHVVSAGMTDAGSIVLERGMTIRGRVLDAGDDSPVAGARVRVGVPSVIDIPLGAPSLDETAVTGSDGTFRVEGAAVGPHDITVEHPDFSIAERRVAVEGDGDPPEVVVRVSKGSGTITGAVRDASGRPIPEEGIVLKHVRRDRTTTTGIDGRYVFERLGASTYSLSRVQGPGTATGMKLATVEEGQTVVVDFGGAPAVRLRGRVMRGGEPAAAVLLFRGGGGETQTSRSGVDGAYEVGLPVAGIYGVTVRMGSGRRSEGETHLMLPVPDEPEVTRDIVIAVSGIAGTVSNAEGRAISNAGVTVDNATTAGGSARTDSSGVYVVEGLEAGNYRVTVSASGFQAAGRFVDVLDTGVVSGIDFRLEPVRLLRGRVVDPHGAGLAGAFVAVRGSTEDPFVELAMSDVNGRFTASAPGDGPVGVGVYAEGWAPVWRTGIVPRDGEETTIVVSPGGKIEIRVLGSDGRPVPGVRVELVTLGADPEREKWFGGSRQPLPTSGDGVALADSLVPGTYELWVTNRRGVVPVQVTVTEGGTIPVVLTLP